MTDRSDARTPFPVRSVADQDRVAAHLVEVITLQHPEGLDPGQLEEVTAAVDAQLRATERLHRFQLGNEDEPAFVLPADGGSR